jgi:hypothetical protein
MTKFFLKMFFCFAIGITIFVSIAWAEIHIAQRPEALPEGKQATRHGDGFTPNGKVIIHDFNPNDDERKYEYFADENGHFEETFIYQAPEFDVTVGQHYFYAIDYETGNRSQNYMYYEITEGPVPTIGTGPLEGVAGTPFERWGDGFTPNGTASLYFYTPDGTEYHTKEIPLTSEGTFSFTSALEVDMAPGVYSWKAVDNATGLEDTVSFTIAEGDLEGINAEIIFAMDTSGSMSDEFEVLCKRINEVTAGLRSRDINVIPKIYGVYEMKDCTENSVYDAVLEAGGDPLVNHNEDWGPAITDLSEHYPWVSQYKRVIIPMSDEDPENGSPWTESDDEAISTAIKTARENGVIVIPILCSGYTEKMLLEAENLSYNIHSGADAFTSEAPADDLIEGIISAISESVTAIESTDVWPYCYIDDAWENPENTNIYKLPGDIIQLVCQINNNINNFDESIKVDLTFEYPYDWEPVSILGGNGLQKRTSMESFEKDLSPHEFSIPGQGTMKIEGIEVPPKDQYTAGRSDDYLLKLTIPKGSEGGNIKFKVEWEDPVKNKRKWKDETLDTVSVTSRYRRFIVTNRTQLYRRYGCCDDQGNCGLSVEKDGCNKNEDINFALSNLYQLAASHKAYVLYVDWWDKYDTFSDVPNSLTQNRIALWNRNQFYNCDSEGNDCQSYKDDTSEGDLNIVANMIDQYTHYWAEETGGKSDDHWLLFIGDDSVIPFYRAQDPSNWTEEYQKAYGLYNASNHTGEMASANWIFTDSIYQDTDEKGWGKGKVDNMYTGRIVQRTSSLLNNYLYNLAFIAGEYIYGDDVTLTSGKGKTCDEDDYFRAYASSLENIFTEKDYRIICQSNSTCSDECKNNTLQDGCLFGSQCQTGTTWGYNDMIFSAMNVYIGHGSTEGPSYKGGYHLSANDIKNSTIFPAFISTHLYACLCGLVDDSDNQNLIAYSFMEKNPASFIGATGLTALNFYPVFSKSFYRQLTSGISIGESINKAKNHTTNGANDKEWHVSNFAFTLYGIPWLTYGSNSHDVIRSYSDKLSPIITGNLRSNAQQQEITRSIFIEDYDYDVQQNGEYEFIKILSFNEILHDQIPVVPSKRIEIDLPLDAEIKSVEIRANNKVDLGRLNIPIYNSIPPIIDIPSQPIYLDPPQELGIFNPIENVLWAEANMGTYKTIIVNAIPIIYDSATQMTELYKDIQVIINYETESDGILENVTFDPSSTDTDPVVATVKVKNTGAYAAPFDIYGVLFDEEGNLVNETYSSITVDPGVSDFHQIQLADIEEAGTYSFEIIVSDSSSEIGKVERQFTLSNGYITNFQVPDEIDSATNASFSLSYQNKMSEDADAVSQILLYKGTQYIGKTPPVVSAVPPRTEQTFTIDQHIPRHFTGEYTAVATVKSNGRSVSKKETFTVILQDDCPTDPDKLEPGVCGCNIPDTDRDGDGTPDCVDKCPDDPERIEGCEPSTSTVVAVAGSSKNVSEGTTVTLNGSGSTTGAGITYQWTQTAGPSVTLTDANSIQASFTAPDVTDDSETLTFRLTVSDADGNTATDICNVAISAQDAGEEPDDDHDGPGDTNNCFINSVFH